MNRPTTLIIAIVFLLAASGFAQTNVPGSGGENEQIRSKVKQFAASKKRVVVVTRLGEKFKGYITSSDDDKFTLDSTGSGQGRSLPYGTVEKVKKSGGLSLGAIAAIAGAAAGAAILIGVLTAPCRNEGNCF